MQDRGEPPQPILTVKDCGMIEFNGTYYIDTAHRNGFVKGKRCYRKNGTGDAWGSECTIEWSGFLDNRWYMTKNFSDEVYYRVSSNADQPPTNGWEVRSGGGSGSPPQLVYEESDVPNFYRFLYG